MRMTLITDNRDYVRLGLEDAAGQRISIISSWTQLRRDVVLRPYVERMLGHVMNRTSCTSRERSWCRPHR